MTEHERSMMLAEIDRSSNPELLCRELDDQSLLALIEIEKQFPVLFPKYATEEYQRRLKFRNQMYREPPVPHSNWIADPQ
jgi:hypothetical protein